jgi:hypothetical protein
MVTRVTPPTTTRPIIDESGEMVQEMRAWTQIITNQALIIGTGSPETVVEAGQGSRYMNDAGTTGNIEYIKRDDNVAGDRKKGWVLV